MTVVRSDYERVLLQGTPVIADSVGQAVKHL